MFKLTRAPPAGEEDPVRPDHSHGGAGRDVRGGLVRAHRQPSARSSPTWPRTSPREPTLTVRTKQEGGRRLRSGHPARLAGGHSGRRGRRARDAPGCGDVQRGDHRRGGEPHTAAGGRRPWASTSPGNQLFLTEGGAEPDKPGEFACRRRHRRRQRPPHRRDLRHQRPHLLRAFQAGRRVQFRLSRSQQQRRPDHGRIRTGDGPSSSWASATSYSTSACRCGRESTRRR